MRALVSLTLVALLLVPVAAAEITADPDRRSDPKQDPEEPEAPEEPKLPPGLGDPDEPELPPGLGDPTDDTPEDPAPGGNTGRERRLPAGLHGFLEARFGPRLQADAVQPERETVADARLRVEYDRAGDRASFDFKADLLADGVEHEVTYEQRQLRATVRIGESVDLRVGRQVLTWGTGDLLFVNDLFPKDWVSFLIGRDQEYLKAPSDAVRVGWYPRGLGVELVYTPRFDSDRYVDGARLSYFNPVLGRLAGRDARVATRTPDDTFSDDELALRLYRNVGSHELAFYAYSGFWKSPAGSDAATGLALFPRLNVYGASVRGPLGPGIANLELGVYDSRDDPSGRNPTVNNGETRLMAGYEVELAPELTGGFQYYLERISDHDRYLETLPFGTPRDENRHVATVRLTRLLRRQTLTLSLFAFLGISDRDAYLRPRVAYRIDDRRTIELGGNYFLGRDTPTFFGQFENDSNVYLAIRFSR